MSSVIYFLSDAHLGAGTAAQERLKRSNLEELFGRIVRDQAGLYILGDLFDFWFEYRAVVQREHADIIAMLAGLRQAGVRVTMLAGNHDYWIGRTFTDRLGIRVVKTGLDLSLDGKRFLLAHGDGLEQGDWGYKFLLKPLLRNPLSIRLFSLLHPDLAVGFAGWFSRLSRKHLAAERDRDGGPLRQAALRLLGQGYDAVVLGHCHRPELTVDRGRTYLNLGEFFRQFTYGVYRGGALSLERIGPATGPAPATSSH
ncbi:MAG: UDP-2,3-diacylglucosamine diphosphatase [Candidatus Edwardsbacteria bacterium]|jgi:UDP-2,3-diacylglucosamine hydrolase|nr:UDP-2,3-diacylglucosamine diphosphatase [Candidatus Edwardsbacteria bacterium]